MSSMKGCRLTSFAILMVLAAVGATAAHGQVGDRTRQGGPADARGEVFVQLDLADPTGEFQRHVDGGIGGRVGGVLHLTRAGGPARVGIRAAASFVLYGSRSTRVPFSSTVPFVDVVQRTTNSIISLSAGPQLYMGRGTVRPYVFGTVGLAYFLTRTSVQGENFGSDPIASTTNLDDLQLALRGGGGLSITLRGGANPISLDLTAAYQYSGLTEYMNQDGLRMHRGRWVVDPITSDANLLTYGAGVSFALR